MSEPAHEPEVESASDLGTSVTDAALAEAGLADPAFADAALTEAEFSGIAPPPVVETQPGPESPSAVHVSAAHCLRCATDLSRLPEAARYCPRCGMDTHASPPATLLTTPADAQPALTQMLGGWKHLSQLLDSPPGAQGAIALPLTEATSVMVKGYGNALFRLGQRYEEAPGATANAREALRCYSKSARLGNVWALARIASHLMAVAAGSAREAESAPIQPPFDSNAPHA